MTRQCSPRAIRTVTHSCTRERATALHAHNHARALLPSFLPSFLPSCLPSFLPSFLPFFLPLFPSFLPSPSQKVEKDNKTGKYLKIWLPLARGMPPAEETQKKPICIVRRVTMVRRHGIDSGLAHVLDCVGQILRCHGLLLESLKGPAELQTFPALHSCVGNSSTHY